MSDNVARIVTFAHKDGVYVRTSSITGQYEGVLVDIWHKIAKDLQMTCDIFTIPNIGDSEDVQIQNKLLDVVETGDADVAMYHASQEQTLGGKKRPSVVNPLSRLYIVLGTIRAKN